VNIGRDIFITHLNEDGSGTNEVEKDHIPFNVLCKPIFDNDRFVYFHECDGTRFGRLDLDTMAFEMLDDAPHHFCCRDGFFMDGCVFCFDKYNKAMKYDCTAQTWSDTNLSIAFRTMVPHPWDNGRVIELMHDGSVREVRVADGRVVKVYNAKYGDIKEYGQPEALALCAPDGAFFLLVCNDNQPWRVFSSKTDTWTETQWPSTGTVSSTAFLDPATKSAFYHINGQDHWTAIGI
jgi:hypothetical protein